MTPDEMQRAAVTAGFADLDSPSSVFALHEIASALQQRRLNTFEDVNAVIGTKNALASGWVRMQCDRLMERGYITISNTWAVALTEKGAGAAVCLGVGPPPHD